VGSEVPKPFENSTQLPPTDSEFRRTEFLLREDYSKSRLSVGRSGNPNRFLLREKNKKEEMESSRPKKPEAYDGKRDMLAVNTWLYQIQVYFSLLEVSNPALQLPDEIKINLASTFLKENTANWWYMIIQSGAPPRKCNELIESIRNEFVPQDSMRRARERLRKLFQKGSVASYINEFRNIVISIPGMNEEEKLDKFCTELKPEVRLKVLKSGPQSLKQAARVALNVDSAIYGLRMFNSGPRTSNVSPSQVQVPMDIGNVEGKQYSHRSIVKSKEQREKDIRNNACFKCHKTGCRPWKCKKQPPSSNHTTAHYQEEQKSEFTSEK